MIGERLAKARKAAGMAQVELAVALGGRYDNTMISHVEHGRSSLLLDGAVRAAKELGVSLDYLTGLTDDPTPAASRNVSPAVPAEAMVGYNPDEANDQDGIWNLPVREVSPAAGSGAEVFGEEVVGYVPFRKGWLAYHGIDPEQADVVQVSGESMEPTLPDGCSILVDRSRRELQPKRIYVLRNEDGLVVKRVDRNREGWWVISDNPAWLPVMLTEDTDIVGQVRWCGRLFTEDGR